MDSTNREGTVATTKTVETGPLARRGLIRRMYDWVLSWADSRWGTPALFVISFAESSFFPIPPDVLQIALSAARPRWSFWYAAVSTVASVLGAILGWYIGYALWATLGDFFLAWVPGLDQEKMDKVGRLYETHAVWTILTAAFTPIPFKIITIAAGVFSQFVPLWTLVWVSLIGRAARFFLVATLLFFFGPVVREFIEKRLELVTIGLAILAALGFAAVKWLG
jgi:membrane protein YqaA with SNARE-associated domain